MLKKIVYAGGNAPSFQRGASDLQVLAEVKVALKQVERLTEQIGQQRVAQRDAAVAAYLDLPLTERETVPPAVPLSQLAVVEMDGGRLQIRSPKETDEKTEPESEATAEQSPAASTGSAAAGAAPPLFLPVPSTASEEGCATASSSSEGKAAKPGRSKHWREDKIGCLLEMTSEVSDVDPCPEIPSVFVDPLLSLKLAQEIGQCAVPPGTPFQRAGPQTEDAAEEERRKRPGRPEIDSRRVIATRQDVHAFGPMLAAAAWAMGLFGALRRAFVADGLAENWSIYKRYFPRWTGVLDFVHAMTYVYAAAMAGRLFAEGWPVYERWIRWVWSGLVGKVIEELTTRQQEVGLASQEDKEGTVRREVQEALTYLSNHKEKMRYDEYRKQGLPLMSSHVESLVKQMNYRVKGTEKFWKEEGAEAILQLRADYLSDNEPMEEFWQRRQEGASGQRSYRRHTA